MCVYYNSSRSGVKRIKKIGYGCGGTDPGNEKSQEEQCTRSREHGFRLDLKDQGSQVGEIHIKREIKFFIGVLLLYNTGFDFAVQQSESAIHMYISPLPWIPFPFRSPQNTEQSSLCSTVGSHQLSILYIAVYRFQFQSPNSPHPSSPLDIDVCSLCLCLYFYFADKFIHTIFLDSTYIFDKHSCDKGKNRHLKFQKKCYKKGLQP